VTVRALPDSTPVQVASILTKTEDDRIHRRAAPARDTLSDTTGRERPGIREVPPAPTPAPAPAPAPGARGRGAQPRVQPEMLTSRPPLTDKLVVRVVRAWTPGTRYEVEIKGVRNTTGAEGDVRGGFTVPKPGAADSTRAKADSAKRAPPGKPPAKPPADSANRRPVKPKP